jgi:hypothetical protein
LAELSIDELAGSLLAHEQSKKLKKRETPEEALQAKVVLEKKKHCMCRRHNRHATVEVVDDVAEENRANGRANRAQTRRDEGAKMVTAEEDPM